MLFQRILQNTIHDHFRRQKVRSTWTTLLSALGQRDEKDDDFDPLETLAGEVGLECRRPIPAAAARASADHGGRSSRRSARCRRVNGKPFCCVTGKNSMWRKPRRDGLFRRQRQDPLLARGSRAGRDAQGQRGIAMTTEDQDFAKENNHLPRPRHGRSQIRHRLPAASSPGQEALARLADPQRATAACTWRLPRRRRRIRHLGGGRGFWTSGLALDRDRVDRRSRVWLSAMAGVPAVERPRGNGRRDPVLGPADRCVPGPGIPELAETRTGDE